MGLKGSQEMAVLPEEFIFMTELCVVREVAVWAKHANSKGVWLPQKDSDPYPAPQDFCS